MKFRIIAAAAAIATAWATGASAGPVSANATANANIVAPATLTSTRTLEFGTIAKPTTGSNTVTIPSAAAAGVTPTLSGAGNAYIPTSNQGRAAIFHLVGTPNEAISVTSNALNFTNQSGNLSNVGPENPVPSLGSLTQLPASGIDDVYVGGHFDISPTTTTQAYTGTLSLTISFN
jgi:hypothetical protein